jgi:hypothetical protein
MRYRCAITPGSSAVAWIRQWLVAGLAATVTDEGQRIMQEAAIMAPAKETGRASSKGNTAQVDGGHGRRPVTKEIRRDGEPTRVDVDPWGAFFENFWEQAADGGSADRPDGGREPAKRTRAKGTKPGR